MNNARLEALTRLSHRIGVYIPSTIGSDALVTNRPFVDECACLLSGFFGGATAIPCVGFWLSDSVGLVKESPTLVYASCDEEGLSDHIDDVLTYAETLKRVMMQESIALELDGELLLM